MVLNTAITRAFSHRSGHHLERHLQEMSSKGRYETYIPPEGQEEGSVWTLPALRGLRVVMWRFQVSAPVPCSCAHMHDKGH